MSLAFKATGALFGVLIAGVAVATYKSTTSFQMGAPGVGMEVINPKTEVSSRYEANVVPASLPAADQDGQLAIDAYKNVQVLGHLPSGEFTRLMAAMTSWVAPDNGCGYCHAPQRDAKGVVLNDEDGNPLADANNMQSDELYTKRVARRMLQMTMRINGEWKDHVKATGVTCYTCHRGNPVPKQIWFDEPEQATRFQGIRNPPLVNGASASAGMTSLPQASLRPFLAGDEQIRVQATDAIGSDDRSSVKQTEWTYALMIHMSNALGVNCTYCHNTRSLGEWSTSPSTRSQAWYGIRMVRELNREYLEPLGPTFPHERRGPLGDGPKVNCATCHQGAYKPLLGVSMLKDYMVLAEARPQPDRTPPSAPAELLPDAGTSQQTGALAGDAGIVGRGDGPATGVGTKAPVKPPARTGHPVLPSGHP